MNRFILTILILMGSIFTYAQQDAMFTHYSFNTLAVNPAYAGSREALTITALHRSQWVSFPGAPRTQTLTMHTPFLSQNVGLGLSMLNDKIGPTKSTMFYADFSYRIRVTEKSWLYFGLKGGMNVYKNDLSKIDPNGPNDPGFGQDFKSELLPNFGFGLYYLAPKYYIGLSIPKLIENDFEVEGVNGTINLGNEQKNYFLILGSVFNLSEKVLLKPTGLLKVTKGAPIQGDITANFIFNNKFRIGGMYRTGAALGVLLGLNITDQLSVGYSYDWSTTNTTYKYNDGSHEIMLRYDFIFNNKKVRSPRYF